MTILASFWETLRLWDQTGLFHINQVWSNKYFDAALPWLREPALWLPVYLFFFVLVVMNFGRNGWLWILFFLITVAFSDQVSNFFKHWIQRPRPCNDPLMMHYIKLRLEYCSPSFSFTSSHAANHFGIAMFVHRTLVKTGIRAAWLFLWALLICYAQMYMGIHYPLDIIGGAIIGLTGGFVLAFIFNQKIGLNFPIAA